MIGPRKIYLNGELIGEVPAAKDEDEHIELAIALMKAQGVYQPTTLVQGIFRQAVSFATTASYLYKRDLTRLPRNGLSVAPFVVNSALAIELYLKTLGQLHGTSLRGHDLVQLFDALPEVAQESLLPHFATSEWQCGIATVAGYRAALEEMRGAFVEWRYLFETDRSGEIKFRPLIFVMEVLHNACRAHDEVRHSRSGQPV